MKFWEMVKMEVAKQNTTQEWVANHSGMTPNVFRSAISKSNEPSVSRAYAIAKALGVTVEYLVSGEVTTGLMNSDSELLSLAHEYKEVLHDLQKMTPEARRMGIAALHAMASEAVSPIVLAPERTVVVPRNRRSGDERVIQSVEQLKAGES